MLQIKVILINRIKDINYFQNIQILLLDLNLQSDAKIDMIDMNKIYQTKKTERSRSQKQANLLMSLNLIMLSNNKQIQEFYQHSVEIFCQFDSYFQKFKNKIQLFSVSMQQNLRRLYTIFFNKYGREQFQLSESLMQDISSLSPSFFFGLIRKWSRNLLDNKIKYFLQLKKQKEEQSKNFQLKGKQLKIDINQKIINKNSQLSLRIQPESLKRNATTAIQSQQSLQKFSIGQNKQNIYAHCLQQMREYYKMMSILDLDSNYLKSFKKTGKKQDLFKKQNQKQVIEILSHRQNKQIMETRQRYQEQFKIYIKKKRSSKRDILENNSQLTLNHKSKQLHLKDIFLNKSCNYKKAQSQLLSQKKSVEIIIDSLIQSKSKDLQRKMNKLKKISVKNQKFNIQFPPINPQKHHNEKLYEKKKLSFLEDGNMEVQNIPKGSKRHQRHPKTSFQRPKKRQQQNSAFGLKCSSINNEVHEKKEMFKIDRGLFYKQQSQSNKIHDLGIRKSQQKQIQEIKQIEARSQLNRKKYVKQMLQVEREKQFQTQKQIIELIKKQKISRLSPIKKEYKSSSKKSIKNQIFDNITRSGTHEEQFGINKKTKMEYVQEYRNQRKLLKLLVYQQMEHY